MGDNAQIQSFKHFAQNVAGKWLASGLSINALRTNNLLRKEEWVELDTEVVKIARQRLIGIADLQARGLTLPLGGLGTLISQYEAESDMTPANVNMSGVTPGEEDDVTFDLRSVPVPITHKDFRINIRRLEASRRLGDAIDTTSAAVAGRRVADGLEGLLFRGSNIMVDGNAIWGYTTHPNRNIGAAPGAPNAWQNINNIYQTALNMIAAAHAARHFGPYILYVAGNVWTQLMLIYGDGSGHTPLERIKNIPGIMDVKPADELLAGNAVLVQMTKDVVDLAVAQDIVTVEWETMGGMLAHFKVMAVMVPRIKSDMNGRSGVVHFTGL